MDKSANVIGAGLAGCEAAWQLANRGVKVTLFDMKPEKKSPAHNTDSFAELVCSNSLRADRLENASGLLKEEMRCLNSLIIQAADKTKVPAGGALAVDRNEFSEFITQSLKNHENVEFVSKEVIEIDSTKNTIIATGPLTSEALAKNISSLMGESLYFYDAAAPIISAESLNMDRVFVGSRYNRGDDYLNCPMNEQEYFAFYEALINAQTVELKEFENLVVFEGCMPVESMAKRGSMSLCFGPLKPVGLIDPKTQKEAFAVVQLRKENQQGSMYNLVGFQTNLKFGEQKRVFSMIPGLENAEFLRYGVMHRNTYINSPKKLDVNYNFLENPNLYFAGQITGVEGYIESASSGLVSGLALAKKLNGESFEGFKTFTALGALSNYVANYSGKSFQPMNINFGVIQGIEGKYKKKTDRYLAIAKRSLDYIQNIQI